MVNVGISSIVLFVFFRLLNYIEFIKISEVENELIF